MANAPSMGPPPRENWASKIGVILAVSGSAVGLGNFLRFPGQAAANGGGAFMIPYFISLIILGIPICWVEWTLGRQGGRCGFNSAPGVFFAVTRNPVIRLFGALALVIPVVIYMYYVYIECWCLGYAYDYLVGNMRSLGFQIEAYRQHFDAFVGKSQNGLTLEGGAPSKVLYFLLAVFLVNFWLIYRGLTKGIERFCKYAMPLLILAAVVVAVRVLTLPPQPVPEPWQYSLREALPPERWTALWDELHKADAQVTAWEADKGQWSNPKVRAEADAALLKPTTAAVEDFFNALRQNRPGYHKEVPVAAPYGYLATRAGIRYAMHQLDDPATAQAHREWVCATRQKLTREQKWDLMHYEASETDLTALVDQPDTKPQDRDAAIRERVGTRTERRSLLETAGLPPGLAAAADPDAYLRGAAAEVAELNRTVTNGLGFMWNPHSAKGGRSIWAALSNPQVWLAASGQIFFSLSVGFGIIITYATYLRRDEDVALNALTASSTNEFCEVCLGGLITIPAAFIFLGMGAVRGAGTFDLGFLTMPTVLAQMPAGQFFGFVWFSMLFLAAITSSLSMLQPAIAFLEEGFGLRRRASVALLGLLTANGCLIVVYFSKGLTALDTMDFWVGSVFIFIMATVLVILFSWVLGAEKCFKLAQDGADIRIPRFFLYVLKYVSPVYLIVIFLFWLRHNAVDYVRSILTNNAATFTAVFVILVLLFFGVLVRLANARWKAEGHTAQEFNS